MDSDSDDDWLGNVIRAARKRTRPTVERDESDESESEEVPAVKSKEAPNEVKTTDDPGDIVRSTLHAAGEAGCSSVDVDVGDVHFHVEWPMAHRRPFRSTLRSNQKRFKGEIFFSEPRLGRPSIYKRWTGKYFTTICQKCVDIGRAEVPKANCPDKNGNSCVLCGPCAKIEGSSVAHYKCKGCVENGRAKVSNANYPDKNGNARVFCGPCARIANSYDCQNPCRDCIKNGNSTVTEANFPDENGRKNALCGPCSRIAGSHAIHNPCQGCRLNGHDTVAQANYADENGRANKLCAQCAVKAGSHVDTGFSGASYVACRCFCRLERALGIKLPHIHYIPGGGHDGKEVKNLLPDHPLMKPDAFVPDKSGKTKGSVYQFHGGEYHGYPPGHAKHATVLPLTGKWGPDAYAATLKKDRLYLEAGYRVFVIWEHEFKECERVKCPRNVTEVCREFLGEHT